MDDRTSRLSPVTLPRRTRPRTFVVIALSMVFAAASVACASDGARPEPPGSGDPTTTSSEALPVLFDEVPDDPAQLGSCAAADDDTDRYTPARWLPTSLADGSTVRFASHRLPADIDVDADWSTVLVGTDSSSTITAAVQVTATLVQGGIAGDPPKDRLRGVPGAVVPSSGRGSGGAFDAMWVEDDVVWRLVAWGLDEARFRAVIERGEFEPDAVTDPTGELTPVSWGPVAVRPLTEIDLSERGAAGARRDLIVVAESVGGGGGLLLEYTGNAMGMQLGNLDGRLALRGVQPASGGSAIASLLTTTPDGSSISVTGAFSMDELETLARSTERVEPDDDRLVGIPMTFPLDDVNLTQTPFCRTDG